MGDPEYLKWSPEEKREFANLRMEAMREENDKLSKRYALVQQDKMAAEIGNSSITNTRRAAEIRNSSVTNTRRRQEVSSAAAERISRDVPRYSREWDRDKVDWDREKKDSADWESYGHKRFQNYRKGDYEKRRNYKNYTKASSRDEKNDQQRYDNASEKKRNYKYYSSDQRSKPRFYDGSSKQSRYQSSESCHEVQQSHEKYKRYYPTDSKKHHSKYRSSSTSTDSECINNKVNKMRVSNTENSTSWHSSDRVNEDKDKRERTLKWVKSVQVEEVDSVQEQKNISSEENNNASPKTKCDKFSTASDKCLDENGLPFTKISYLKSPKLVSNKSKATTTEENEIMEQKLSEPCRKSYTKFDRYNRSDHSSDDISSSDECDVDKTKSEVNCTVESTEANLISTVKSTKAKLISTVESTKAESICTVESTKAELNCNLESKKHDYNEKENGSSEKINSKCNLKLQNSSSGGSKDKIEKLSISASKSSSYYSESHPTKKSYDIPRPNPASKISSSNASREYTYNDRGCNFSNNEKDRKKGFKTKRDTETSRQYNSPDSFKSDHITKQRKFDKRQSDDSWSNSVDKNRGLRNEKYCHDKKKSNFSVVPSLNQDDDDGWGNIEQSTNKDEDGIWASADQSDIKWKISEDNNTGKKNKGKVVSDSHHNEKGAKSFKVKNPTMSDDGGWSTVEEGEIISDDNLEENKEHVK